MKITILGAGAYGTALGGILEENEHEVVYYDLNTTKTLAETAEGSAYAILCVPSSVAEKALKQVPTTYPLIVATKGILDISVFNHFSEVIAVSGPGFADDIRNHKKTYLTATDKQIDALFQADYLEFDHTTDFKGVLLSGALKNVYAVEAGRRGLERASEAWQEYIENALAEMKKIFTLNGAKPETADLYCGIGDLKLTCGLPSRNFAYGLSLFRHEKPKANVTVEGLTTLGQIKNGAIKIPENASIMQKLLANNISSDA